MKENNTGCLLSAAVIYSFDCILPRYVTWKSPLCNAIFSDILKINYRSAQCLWNSEQVGLSICKE